MPFAARFAHLASVEGRALAHPARGVGPALFHAPGPAPAASLFVFPDRHNALSPWPPPTNIIHLSHGPDLSPAPARLCRFGTALVQQVRRLLPVQGSFPPDGQINDNLTRRHPFITDSHSLYSVSQPGITTRAARTFIGTPDISCV